MKEMITRKYVTSEKDIPSSSNTKGMASQSSNTK
jgi:hypothetical protein